MEKLQHSTVVYLHHSLSLSATQGQTCVFMWLAKYLQTFLRQLGRAEILSQPFDQHC